MRRLLVLLFLLACAMRGFTQELSYRSNSFGMLLERIETYQRDESRWVLTIQRKGGDEVRRLYDKGKEVHRWETTWTQSPRQKVERELEGDELVARTVTDAAGNLVQEEQYSAGVLSEKSLYTYAGSRLLRKRVLAPDGSVLSTEEYLYGSNGALREVRRTGADEQVEHSAFVIGPSGVSEERDAVGDAFFVLRYDTLGRLTNQERREGGEIVSREDFTYRPDSRLLLSSTERLFAEGKVVERRYDDAGRLTTETTSAGGSVVEEVRYLRDSKGNVTTKTRSSSAGLETWRYTLDSAGKTTREEYFNRGALEKVTVYGEEKKRTEELYKNEELFLKIYYDGDTKLLEEVYAGGKLLRERKYQ